MPKYGRILLKLSGEVLAGQGSFGVDPTRVAALATEVSEVARTGVQIGLVVGGGNFFRTARFKWKADILHFHWVHPYILRPSRLGTVVRGTRFIAEVAALKRDVPEP